MQPAVAVNGVQKEKSFLLPILSSRLFQHVPALFFFALRYFALARHPDLANVKVRIGDSASTQLGADRSVCPLFGGFKGEARVEETQQTCAE